ncbi:MAG TPA: DUF503 domain-containing protein [Dehalococcoidia bacterium]|nr:DUF503 domain-containing protein [Dehalococcoidia bacterium]
MNTGICKVKLHLRESQSLKDKRRILKSIVSRLRNQYNVSIAEVDDQDLWQLATLGVTCVSNHNQHVDETLSKVMNFIVHNYPDLEVVDHEIEILRGL